MALGTIQLAEAALYPEYGLQDKDLMWPPSCPKGGLYNFYQAAGWESGTRLPDVYTLICTGRHRGLTQFTAVLGSIPQPEAMTVK